MTLYCSGWRSFFFYFVKNQAHTWKHFKHRIYCDVQSACTTHTCTIFDLPLTYRSCKSQKTADTFCLSVQRRARSRVWVKITSVLLKLKLKKERKSSSQNSIYIYKRTEILYYTSRWIYFKEKCNWVLEIVPFLTEGGTIFLLHNKKKQPFRSQTQLSNPMSAAASYVYKTPPTGQLQLQLTA